MDYTEISQRCKGEHVIDGFPGVIDLILSHLEIKSGVYSIYVTYV